MDTSSKTAEKIKAFVDQVDEKARELENDIKDVVQTAKAKYHRELEKAKSMASESHSEASEIASESIQQAKNSFEKITAEARSFMETKLEPLNQRLQDLKEEAHRYSEPTEDRWQETKKETDELVDTTKLAVHNFKETFKSHFNQQS